MGERSIFCRKEIMKVMYNSTFIYHLVFVDLNSYPSPLRIMNEGFPSNYNCNYYASRTDKN